MKISEITITKDLFTNEVVKELERLKHKLQDAGEKAEAEKIEKFTMRHSKNMIHSWTEFQMIKEVIEKGELL